MNVVQLKEGIYSVGVQNPSLRVFDIIMATKYGTSYNAYLVAGKEKTALIETVHLTYFEEYLENLQAVCDIHKIDYLILNHTEPDHSGSVRRLLELNPDITVIATTAAHKYLANITNISYQQQAAKPGSFIDLGGIKLEFIPVPMLHWPDSMFTWCPEQKTLFSCDFLGAHYCEPRLLDTKITYPDQYLGEFKNYYEAIFSPFKPYVLAGLDKIKDLPLECVCPSHGPILMERIQSAQALYREWSTPVSDSAVKKVLIVYVSAYGCTKKIAEILAQTLTGEFGIEVETINLVEQSFDGLAAKINSCHGLLFGTPTITRDALAPIWQASSMIDAITNKGKAAGVFGSYGWSGEGVPMIVERFKGLKLNVVGDGVTALFVPSEEETEKIREYARTFAAAVQ